MLADLSSLIAATAQWLTRSYPSDGSAMDSALSEVQARQAVTVAAWLRYPTRMDAALVGVAGPGGSGRLDWITGADGGVHEAGDGGVDAAAWRTWVDEVVASWAACLLTDPELAGTAVAALADCDHTAGVPIEFRRLTAPDHRARRAAALLRHPDLLAPIADLHHAALLDRLTPGEALTA
ncbi:MULTISPECIES: hypothetical protein [unclassified Streptomyces]|uniref:hypothetical protein n=1 Tax=unclassified Streptomyces TaxID=2593676 RepID=UPI0033B9C93D